MPRIAFLGLGNMGRPMAANLLRAGFPVTVYNRHPARAQALVEQGARAAGTIAEAVREAEVVITMVSDDAAVRDVILGDGGVLASAVPGTLVIDMSTISPDTSREVAAELHARGLRFLDAPVSGSVKPATEGTLVILVGGAREDFDQALPLFQAMGKEILHLGANGSGAHMKLCVNLLIGALMQGTAEAIILAETGGLAREQLLTALCAGALQSPLLKMKVPAYLAGEYPPAFALKHMAKDYGLAMAQAQRLDVPLPLAAAGNETFKAAKSLGYAEADVAGIILALERIAGRREA